MVATGTAAEPELFSGFGSASAADTVAEKARVDAAVGVSVRVKSVLSPGLSEPTDQVMSLDVALNMPVALTKAALPGRAPDTTMELDGKGPLLTTLIAKVMST